MENERIADEKPLQTGFKINGEDLEFDNSSQKTIDELIDLFLFTPRSRSERGAISLLNDWMRRFIRG